ncbi:hypothetical protein BaRGS_00012945, partial [Batillaria attramentaria]
YLQRQWAKIKPGLQAEELSPMWLRNRLQKTLAPVVDDKSDKEAGKPARQQQQPSRSLPQSHKNAEKTEQGAPKHDQKAPEKQTDSKPKPDAKPSSSTKKRLSFEEIGQRFEKRRRRLESACQRHKNSSEFNKLKPNFMKLRLYHNVSAKYCPIAKTSSWTWRGVLGSVREALREQGRPYLMGEGAKEILYTFTREPYSRLLSGYVDKLFNPNTVYCSIYGKFMVAHFRKNATENSIRCGHDVTFPEFVKYFIHVQKQHTSSYRDTHFIPTHDHCDFCNIPYKYIAHQSTFLEDTNYILQVINSTYRYKKNYDAEAIDDYSTLYLKRLRPRVVKCMTLDEAARRLWKSFKMRGILSKNQPFPFTLEQTQDLMYYEFTRAAMDAYAKSEPKSVRSKQREEAMREAFASVPLEDRLELKKLLHLDFEFFGFDPEPDTVFPKEPYKRDPNFSYFDVFN